MTKARVEAFSDAVIAIVITVMVLEMKAPHGDSLGSLKPIVPVFLNYLLSFLYLGIYWNNHHHLLHAVKHVTARIMWANLHLLFWLSLIPFVTGWMGENPGSSWPAALYGCVLLMAGFAYLLLQGFIVTVCGQDSRLARIFADDWKGRLSVFTYAAAIALAFVNPWCSAGLYVAVAMMWLVPDKRVEKALAQ